jgi:putative glutamine amidotransferase
MKPPVIGITCSWDAPRNAYLSPKDYAAAVAGGGGRPILLPHLEVLNSHAKDPLESIDGLLLSGGTDLDPAAFGEEPRYPLKTIDPTRDAFELALCRAALEAGVPIFGICRGIQVLNLAAGGTVYQDLAGQVDGALRHEQDAPRWHPTHAVSIEEGTRLHAILQETACRVNSFHHQAVRDVARGFAVSARATDGVIEAIESVHAPFALGVQWHPENTHRTLDTSKRLFAAFVAAAGSR